MKEETKKKKFGIIELFLLLGCLGAIEIIAVSFFWDEIIRDPSLKLFRDGQLLSKLAIIAIVLGMVGLFNYIVGLFTESLRTYKTRNVLGIAYFVGFIIVAYIKSGV